MVAAAIRTIFTQPTGPGVRAPVDIVADMLAEKLPALAGLLHDVVADITAFADFTEAHWRKSGSGEQRETTLR